MFNIGPLELMVVLMVALVVVGPKRLPEIGRQIGKAIADLRRVQNEVKDTIRFDLDEEPEPPRRREPHRKRKPLDQGDERSEGPEPEREASATHTLDAQTRTDVAVHDGESVPADPGDAFGTPDEPSDRPVDSTPAADARETSSPDDAGAPPDRDGGGRPAAEGDGGGDVVRGEAG